MKKTAKNYDNLQSEILHSCSMMEMLHGKGDRTLKINKNTYEEFTNRMMEGAVKHLELELPIPESGEPKNDVLQLMQYRMNVKYDESMGHLEFHIL